MDLSEKEAASLIRGKLSRYFGVTGKEASREQLYKAVVMCVRDILLEKRNKFSQKVRAGRHKRVYYLCIEYLMGRSLKNNASNLGVTEAFDGALRRLGTSMEELYESEPDAGLGNGGLGRLAACFLDALATGDYPAMGYSICYEYGLFRQKIVDGWQTELPDVWLPGGEVWLTQRADKTFTVKFDGHIREEWTSEGLRVRHDNPTLVEAIPYDMMVSGADSEAVSVLRLWRAKSPIDFDMKSFSQGDYMAAIEQGAEAETISKVLYPSDNHSEGKSLRLKQQYFLVSASLQNILADHKKRYGSLDALPDLAAIHINDTHPALAIPELMRLLMDENGYSWEKAWDITTRTVAYTNHTVMSEALEKWQEDLVARRLPRIYSIIREINERFSAEVWLRSPGDWDRIERMAVISHEQVRMANLAVIGSHSVNGVSALHSEIIRASVFRDFAELYPEKFTNVTNGIAHRRWLCQANPRLAALLDECIGRGYRKDSARLRDFASFAENSDVLGRMAEIKRRNKEDLCRFVKTRGGPDLDPASLFDVQAKRMHEYKRQLLNVLRIVTLRNAILDDPNGNFAPKTFLFGAKAAPGYYMAKRLIKLICYLAEDIRRTPALRGKLDVVYLEDYSVTVAELLMPAAEISEQISLAGKEASGTGNMKFMINGALTVGTLDGANVEMLEEVGKENMFIFGMTASEVEERWRRGYHSTAFYDKSERLRAALAALSHGFNGESFADVTQYLLTASPVADPYMCLADYESFLAAHEQAEAEYRNEREWQKKSVLNVAASGKFSADRAIGEYAENIWRLRAVK